MMIEKENGTLEGNEFGSLWVKVAESGHYR